MIESVNGAASSKAKSSKLEKLENSHSDILPATDIFDIFLRAPTSASLLLYFSSIRCKNAR